MNKHKNYPVYCNAWTHWHNLVCRIRTDNWAGELVVQISEKYLRGSSTTGTTLDASRASEVYLSRSERWRYIMLTLWVCIQHYLWFFFLHICHLSFNVYKKKKRKQILIHTIKRSLVCDAKFSWIEIKLLLFLISTSSFCAVLNINNWWNSCRTFLARILN